MIKLLQPLFIYIHITFLFYIKIRRQFHVTRTIIIRANEKCVHFVISCRFLEVPRYKRKRVFQCNKYNSYGNDVFNYSNSIERKRIILNVICKQKKKLKIIITLLFDTNVRL